MTMFINRVLPSFFPVKPIGIISEGLHPTKDLLAVDSIDVLLKNRSVPLALHLSKSHIDVGLLFCARGQKPW